MNINAFLQGYFEKDAKGGNFDFINMFGGNKPKIVKQDTDFIPKGSELEIKKPPVLKPMG